MVPSRICLRCAMTETPEELLIYYRFELLIGYICCNYLLLYGFLLTFFFVCLHPQHAKVTGPGIKPQL